MNEGLNKLIHAYNECDKNNRSLSDGEFKEIAPLLTKEDLESLVTIESWSNNKMKEFVVPAIQLLCTRTVLLGLVDKEIISTKALETERPWEINRSQTNQTGRTALHMLAEAGFLNKVIEKATLEGLFKTMDSSDSSPLSIYFKECALTEKKVPEEIWKRLEELKWSKENLQRECIMTKFPLPNHCLVIIKESRIRLEKIKEKKRKKFKLKTEEGINLG